MKRIVSILTAIIAVLALPLSNSASAAVGDQQAGYPLLFVLVSNTSGETGNTPRIGTGNFTGPFVFDPSASFEERAKVHWLPHDRAKIDFPDVPGAGLGKSGIRIEVGKVAAVPEPATGLLALLGVVPALMLFRARRGRPESSRGSGFANA